MSLSDFDLHLGQLALARGHVELFELLECTAVAEQREQSLEQALVASGLLTASVATTLREETRSMSPQQLREVISQGDTIALQTLADQEQQHRCSEGQLPPDSVDIAETLAPVRDTLDGDPEPATPTQTPAAAWPAGGDSRYEIIDELGSGGMGQIFRARDRLLDREIALKKLWPDNSEADSRQRLIAEAQLTGQLEHPSIVPVYELGRMPDGEPYYTMRVVPEHTLVETIDRLGDGDGPSMLRIAQILRQVCMAVHFAHENGVIHRDLKPENILLGEYGEVFVIDWGIALVRRDFDDVPSPTSQADHQPGAIFGTPQYMAPEQARGDNEQVDVRTDIYAIGAILYEILTLSPVFTHETAMGLLLKVVREEPPPPSERAPNRDIPEPLEEICMRALSKEPRDRYPTAQALADELNLYIEGVKDRERDEQRARELIEEARRAHDDYERTREQLQKAVQRRHRLRNSIPGWADPGERVQIWEVEERVQQLEVELERKFGETTRLLSQSIGHMPLAEAHDALASMYWQRFIDAERRDDRQMATHFENLVRQHDTGAFTERLEGRADLKINATPDRAELTLYRIAEQHRRLVPSETIVRSVGAIEAQNIPHGRYRLVAEADGHKSVQMPVKLDRLDTRNIDLQLWPEQTIPEDFVVIPEGEFITGSPEEIGDNRTYLDDFAIQRTPVTCGEYLEFLNDLAADDLERARSHAPRTDEEAESYFPVVDGRFVLPESDAEGDSWDPNWPIGIVNYHDACAYAQWRSRRDDLPFRLPTADEWEKAARGVDGRLYPWGTHFDPSFCRMRDSLTGKPIPAPVGTHPEDVSPYGVLDMAGNLCEWTNTPAANAPDTIVLRGGAYNSIALTCRLYWYQNSPPSFRFGHYGFRLALELPDHEQGRRAPN